MVFFSFVFVSKYTDINAMFCDVMITNLIYLSLGTNISYCVIIFMLPEKNWGSIKSPPCPSVRPSVRTLFVISLFEVGFRNYFTEMTTMLRRHVACNIWVTNDLAAKSCPAHNLVIWSRLSKIFHRNDHHIGTTCCRQHLGGYLEDQCHSMTLQQSRVRPITLLFEVRFWNNYTVMITILTWRVARNIWVATLKVKFTAWPFSIIMCGL